MKLKKLGAFAATGAMALALALTGCGSSNATSGSDASSSSSDDAKVEKVDGSKEYALVKDGTLTVGTSAEYAPFEYKDDNGDYQGFDLELIKAIGDKLGLDVEYVNNDFDTLVPGVASGAKYDVSIAAITDTPEREKEVTFSSSSLARPPSPLPRRTSPRPRLSPTRTPPSASAPCSPIRATP